MDLRGAIDLVEEHVKDLIDLCPHCGAKAHIEKLWNAYHTLSNRDAEFYVVFRCRPCRKLILKIFLFEQSRTSSVTNLSSGGWVERFPVSLDTELSKEDTEYIPEQVFADYKEALKCRSIGANRASCSMFRRALQNGLVQLGADSNTDLVAQIDSLTSLPEDIKDWAHQVRIFGNWGAHPDKDNLKDVGPDDVTEAYDFISKLFTYMFVMPEKVKLSRQRRDERLNDKDTEQS